jgi:hypothetical protein
MSRSLTDVRSVQRSQDSTHQNARGTLPVHSDMASAHNVEHVTMVLARAASGEPQGSGSRAEPRPGGHQRSRPHVRLRAPDRDGRIGTRVLAAAEAGRQTDQVASHANAVPGHRSLTSARPSSSRSSWVALMRAGSRHGLFRRCGAGGPADLDGPQPLGRGICIICRECSGPISRILSRRPFA